MMALTRLAVLTLVVGALVACASSAPVTSGERSEAAREKMAGGNLAAAETEAKLALQGDPLDAEAHFVLASALAAREEYDEAVVGYQRVFRLDPTHPTAAYNIGTAHLLREEPIQAARWLEVAAQVRPDHPAAFVNLGKAYFLAGLPVLAAASFEHALELDPDNRPARANLARLYAAAGRPDLADRDRSAELTFVQSGPEKSAGPERPAPGRPAPDKPAPDRSVPAVRDLDSLREFLDELPHVTVGMRAGRPTIHGWTRNETERALLDRVLKERPDVLDLTTGDKGDSQEMIEVDATLFVVVGVDSESLGFNFLKMIDVTFDYFASDHASTGAGLGGPGKYVESVSGGWQSGWLASAAVDYDVTIANAVDERVAILARPHLTTLSGTPATFISGGEFVFRVTGNVGGNIEPYPFGTTLNVTPTLLRTPAEDGGPRVHLKVDAGRMSILNLLTQSDSDFEAGVVFDKVNVTGEAVLDIGQTLILSGLSQKERRTGNSGVPFLRDIPILKWVFSNRYELEVDTTVIILLTPRQPAYVDRENRKAIKEFIEMRRAFVEARQGSEADFERFAERYPDWEEMAPNRFASHFFLVKVSEAYRNLSGYDLEEAELDIEILDPLSRRRP